MASPATEVSQGGHPAAFCSASTNLHDNLKDTDPVPPLKLPLLHSRASPSRASAATPFRFRPDPLLPCLRELERTMHGPSGVEPPAPATVFFELAQPILAAETGREHRLRGKRSCQRENGAKPRNISIEKEGKMVTLLLFPRSFVSAFFSLSLSRFQKWHNPTILFFLSLYLYLPSCEICGGFSRMSRTVVRHSRVPMGASLFGVRSNVRERKRREREEKGVM